MKNSTQNPVKPLAAEVARLNAAKEYTKVVSQTKPVAPATPDPVTWVWSTYTILGERYRFQGRQIAGQPGVWYVHVCRLVQGAWQRVSYGYQYGKTLPEIAQTWALCYVSAAA